MRFSCPQSACARLKSMLAGYFSLRGHDHGDLYYERPDVDDLLSGKSDVGHTHTTAALIVGEVRMFAGAGVPDGWLNCNGDLVYITDYSDLFDAIGYTYGSSGDGKQFGVPNMYGRFPIGRNSSYPLGAMGGVEEHELSIAEMPSHRHRLDRQQDALYSLTDAVRRVVSWGTGDGTTVQSEYIGGGNPHTNMPPYTALKFIIHSGVYT